MASKSKNNDKQEQKLEHCIEYWVVRTLCFSLPLLAILYNFFPGWIPYSFFHFWEWNIAEGMFAVWPIFLWGASVTFLGTFLASTRSEVLKQHGDAPDVAFKGILISVWAGVVEELIFRWIIFYTMMFFVQLTSLLTCGIVEWIYLHIEAPILWFLSFGHLEWLLYNQEYWYIGAGAVAANIRFRNGHKYLGLLGYLNSYVLGFVFFWLMFVYGLPAAIFCHFLYDLIIYGVIWVRVLK